MADGSGLPLAFTLTPGQRHEMSAFERTLEALRLPGLRGRPRTRPRYLAGDKACSYRPVFACLRRRRLRPVIPTRQAGNMGKGCPRRFDPDLCRRRNAIERCVGWLKGGRSIATRHERLAVNFGPMLKRLPAPIPADPQAVRQDLDAGDWARAADRLLDRRAGCLGTRQATREKTQRRARRSGSERRR